MSWLEIEKHKIHPFENSRNNLWNAISTGLVAKMIKFRAPCVTSAMSLYSSFPNKYTLTQDGGQKRE